MKVLLILPPTTLEERYNKAIAKAAGRLPPLGLLYIAAVLKDKHQIRVFDGSMQEYSQLIKLIKQFKPDFVGIESMSLFWPTLKRIIPQIRNIVPNAHISLGGAFVYLKQEKCLEEIKEIDSLVVGEGEETIVELTECLKKNRSLKGVRGIIYRDKKNIRINKARPLIKNIDVLPFPAREFVDILKYIPAIEQYKRKPVTNINTIRGCPYNCIFCAKTMDSIARFRSPERVVEEIKLLSDKYAIKEVSIWDDIFTLNKKRAIQIMKQLRNEKLDITFSAHSRVDLVDRELLREMKKSGCWKIFYGVESMLQKNLDMLRKGTTVQQNYDAIKWTKAEGIESEVSVIFGIPNETYEDCLETIKRAIKLDPDYIKFTYLTPYGQLVNKIREYGRIISTDLKDYTECGVVFVPNTITKEKLQTILPKAYKNFYFRLGYIAKYISRVRRFEDIKRALKGFKAIASL